MSKGIGILLLILGILCGLIALSNGVARAEIGEIRDLQEEIKQLEHQVVDEDGLLDSESDEDAKNEGDD